MKEIPILVLRALLGGTAVCAFTVISEMVKPKKFAGIFAAAPAVAIASLGITAATKGPGAVHDAALGMIAGACGMIAYCLVAVFAVRRLNALRGSIASFAVWGAVAGAAFVVAR
jgi:uncharacterized membrane protein (GlpM family)